MVNFEKLYNLFPGIIILPCGSNVLPYIQHPNDTDYLILCQSEQQEHDLFELRRHNFGAWRQYGDLKVRCLKSQNQLIRPWLYTYQYFPDEIRDQLPTIFSKHDEILQLMRNYHHEHPTFDPNNKGYYHMYTCLAMWQKGTYQLTDDEILRINRFHDHCATQEDYDLLVDMLYQEKESAV